MGRRGGDSEPCVNAPQDSIFFFRRADVIPKLKLALQSRGGESRASHCPSRDLPHADRTEPNRPTEQRLVREATEKKAQSSPSGTRRRGIFQEQENRSPAFCGQRRLEPPLLLSFCPATATTKMNRSFHKSQPLRTVDCNAVEVKSKVGLKRREVEGNCWRSIGGGGGG